MKNIVILIKKDFTIDKFNVIIIILLSIGIPLYITFALQDLGFGQGSDFASLLLSSFYCFFMVLSKLGLIEHKYKGAAYLTLTPISRKDIVVSKYVFLLLVFIMSILGYIITYLLVPAVKPLSLPSIIIAGTANIIFLGLYIPLEFKLGYENMKYYFMVLIVATPLLIGFLGKYMDVSIFQNIIENVEKLIAIMIVFSTVFIAISYNFSLKIFMRKDL